MYELLHQWTAVVLIGGWIALALLARRRHVLGTVVRMQEAPFAGGLLPATLFVRTDDGREIAARVGGCVRCQTDLRPGRMVRLIRDREGYVVAGGTSRTGEARCR